MGLDMQGHGRNLYAPSACTPASGQIPGSCVGSFASMCMLRPMIVRQANIRAHMAAPFSGAACTFEHGDSRADVCSVFDCGLIAVLTSCVLCLPCAQAVAVVVAAAMAAAVLASQMMADPA